ncbi:hypothetical protein CAEBREN_06286 [Caenorhabditis brenneri]|uniref:Chromo domain-containing protein n=1 Tax=Caenorhabditis brenneri TaxID=135651 RepID=G0MLM7_CAEBE|nr:hypothetical protein CAEBREN_06286 [Caenorhabditis brenneri]
MPKKILDRRVDLPGVEEFLVEWENNPVKTWEYRDGIPDAARLIREFERELFQVEAILKRKMERGKKLYLVKWRGYSETTWEPTSSFPFKKMLRDFEKSKKNSAATSTSSSHSTGQQTSSSKKRGKKRN